MLYHLLLGEKLVSHVHSFGKVPDRAENQDLVAPPVLIVNLATDLVKWMPLLYARLNLPKLKANARPVFANLARSCDPCIKKVLSQLLLSEDWNVLAIQEELIDRERRVDC